MADILKYEIESVIKILKGFNLEHKSPEALTNAALITIGDKIKKAVIKGEINDDDLNWIKDYCNDIKYFWREVPTWLRKNLNNLSSSAKFNARGLSQTTQEAKLNKMVWAYKELTMWFIGVYVNQQKKAAA